MKYQVCPSHALLMMELVWLGDEQWVRMCEVCAVPHLQAWFEWEDMLNG